MKKRALNPLAVTNVRFTLTFFTQLLVLLLFFNVPVHAQWQKLTNLPAAKVNAIAINSVQPQEMWAGLDFTPNNTFTAGLYRSQNNGLTWAQVSPTSLQGIPLSNKPVRSISVAPDNNFSSSLILVAFANEGIYRSVDGGNTFVAAQITNPQLPGTFLKQNVSQVVATKLQGTTRKLYAVVEDDGAGFGLSTSGLYSASIVSPTQQIAWQRTGFTSLKIKKLVVNPNNANILYIVTTDSRIMKSNDGGANFIDSNSGLPAGVGAVISDFAIDPTLDSTLYASGFQGGVKGFYKSINSGISWTVVNQSEVFHRITVGNVNGLKTLYGIKTETGFNTTQPRYEVYQSQNEGLSWSKLDTSLQSQLTGNTLNTIETNNGSVFVGGDDGLFSFSNGVGGVPNGLSVMATANPITVQPGGQLSVTLTVTNTTQSLLNNVTVLGSTLPFGTVMSSFNVPECNLASTQINCTLNNLVPNVPVTKILTFTMPSTLGTGSSLTFNASDISPTTGQQLSGNSLPINIGGAGSGTQNGLSVTVTSTPTIVTTGGQVTFSMTVTNLTTASLPAVSVNAGTFPFGTTAGTFGSAPECTVSTQISCNLTNLAPNVPQVKTIIVKLPATAAVPTTPITFNASAFSSTTGQQLSGSSAPINLSGSGTGIQNGLSLTVTKTPVTVTQGGQVTFSMTVTNLTTLSMPSVSVTAAGFPFGTTAGTFGSAPECTVSTQINCNLTNLAPNVPQVKTIIVQLPTTAVVPTTPITFNARTPNNASTASSAPVSLSGSGTGAQNGLSVTVTKTPVTVTQGGQVTFSMTVTNLTTLSMPSVSVTATGFPFGTAAGTFGSAPECTVSTQISCNLTNLAPNVPQVKTIIVRLPTTAAVPVTPITFNARTPNGLSTGASAPVSLSGSGTGAQNGLSVTVTKTPVTVTQGGQVTFSMTITNLTTLSMPSVSVTATGFPFGTTAGTFGSAPECTVSTQISCNLTNLAPNVPQVKTIIVRLPTTAAVPVTPITFNARTPNGLSTGASAPLSLSGDSVGIGSVNFTVTPATLSVSANQTITFNVAVTNQSQTTLSNVSFSGTNIPSGAQAVSLSSGCSLNVTTISCQIATLRPNVPVNLSLSVRMPVTLPVSLPQLSFTLNAGPNSPVVKPVTLTSAVVGSIFANSGNGQATVGTPYVGTFTSSSVSATTVYQLAGQVTKGTFAWNSPSCVNQTSPCNSGTFTYTPNSNSGGQTEIIQFTVRANATSTPSPMASYTISITGSNGSSGGSLGPWLFVVFFLTFLLSRRRMEA